MDLINQTSANRTSPGLKKQFKPGDVFYNKNSTNWTKENILAGFQKFFQENGRYPTAPEIDKNGLLPSSRQIQRAFGGLRNLRKDLGLEIYDYGRGESRSKIAFESNRLGGVGEREMEQILVNHFGEHFVHVEKTLYKYINPNSSFRKDSKCRVDFLVYAKDYTFGVDVFHAHTLKNLIGNIGIKSKKYCHLNIDIYLVSLNEGADITDENIARYLNNKKLKLTPNIKVLSKSAFLEIIQKIPILKVV